MGGTRRKEYHPEDIKAAVRKRGTTLAHLSREAGLCSAACSLSLRHPIPAANRAVAAFLGLALHQLWPQWYTPAGKRIRSRSTTKVIPITGRRHRQKRREA